MNKRMAKLKPTGFKPAFLRQCIDVLSADPPLLRWRGRPRSHFPRGEKGDLAFKIWGNTFAGQTVRPQDDGRLRLSLTLNGERRKLDARAIIAEIGVTPLKERFGPGGGLDHDGPNDRFADVREIAGAGPLAETIREAMTETGRSLTDLTVLYVDNDPYRMDTPSGHRVAQWFAALVERFIAPDRNIHPRGVFYACVSAGDVTLPNGDRFENTAANAKFVTNAAGLARWLRYVPFERIIDQKNDEPEVIPAPTNETPVGWAAADVLDIETLDPDALGVTAALEYFEPRQPYRLVFFGEKSSLREVLGPLAAEVGADLYLTGGQISDTLMHRMASDAVDDGRPLVVLTFSDFDPAGYWDMPTVIGRKLQALRDLLFPDLKFTVVHAALGPEQVRRLDLPDSPLKEGESRAGLWKELYGSEQTEIDALATLNPEELERIARAAVAPYFDADLAAQVEAAEADWLERADAEIAAQIDDERVDELKVHARGALDELRQVNADLSAVADGVEVSEPPDLPEPDMDRLEKAQEKRRDTVLIDSDMDFVKAVDRLKNHSELAARRTKQARERSAP
jgi:hypothetical protein